MSLTRILILCPDCCFPLAHCTCGKEDAPHRGSRCGVCYWALYDGDRCQNPECAMHGKSVNENRVHLTNGEAQILIKAKAP